MAEGIRFALPSRARLRAVLQQRCPNCLQGKVFDGWLHMRDHCPICGHQFVREQGYFMGAMYVSYGMGIVIGGLLTLVVLALRPGGSEVVSVAIAVPIFLLLVPLIWRYSRIIWMHLFYRAF